MDELENRIIELEIRLALQDELVGSLNDTVAKMQNTLDLQQARKRLRGRFRWRRKAGC